MEDLNNNRDGAYYDAKATERRGECSPAENRRRAANGKKPNVSGQLPDEHLQVLLPTQKKTIYDA